MWVKIYLIQLILSFHISLYKNLSLYHYSYTIEQKDTESEVSENGAKRKEKKKKNSLK